MNKLALTTYQKLCTEFYDLELEQHQDADVILSFYMAYARQANGPILEPMCGTGRFLIPMLQAGLDAEGFDASEHMLAAFKQKYARISHTRMSHTRISLKVPHNLSCHPGLDPGSSPPVWQQFVQDFSSDKRYQLIFVPFGSWGLIIDRESSQQCLKNMYHHLALEGKFVIEIETVASVPETSGIWRRGVHTRADGSKIALNLLTSYAPTTQIFTSFCRYELLIGDKINAVEVENFQQYHYRFDEMDILLKDVGFTQIKKYKDYSKAPATSFDTCTIIYECIK